MNTNKKKIKYYIINLLFLTFFLTGLYLVAKPFIYDYLNAKKAEETLALLEKERLADLDKKRLELQKNSRLYSGADVKSISKETYQKANAKNIIFNFGIGKIYFEEQNITVPVVEGVTNDALLVGAGTLKSHQVVGKGNFALAGHRLRTNESVLFSHIADLEAGNHVELSIGSNKATYIITNKRIIDPTDVKYISDDEGNGLLSLVCCTDDGTKRWLVVGTLEKNI